LACLSGCLSVSHDLAACCWPAQRRPEGAAPGSSALTPVWHSKQLPTPPRAHNRPRWSPAAVRRAGRGIRAAARAPAGATLACLLLCALPTPPSPCPCACHRMQDNLKYEGSILTDKLMKLRASRHDLETELFALKNKRIQLLDVIRKLEDEEMQLVSEVGAWWAAVERGGGGGGTRSLCERDVCAGRSAWCRPNSALAAPPHTAPPAPPPPPTRDVVMLLPSFRPPPRRCDAAL
jgi:hypothetical protein